MEHSRTQRPELAPSLKIAAWADPAIDTLGYDVLDRDNAQGQPPYCETFWLPLIGPSTLLLLRRANQHLETSPDTAIPSELLPPLLGLGPGTGRSSRIADTIARAERFNFAHLGFEGDELRVRTHLPPLPQRLEKRLPPALAALHQQIRSDQSRTQHPAGRGDVRTRPRLTVLTPLEQPGHGALSR